MIAIITTSFMGSRKITLISEIPFWFKNHPSRNIMIVRAFKYSVNIIMFHLYESHDSIILNCPQSGIYHTNHPRLIMYSFCRIAWLIYAMQIGSGERFVKMGRSWLQLPSSDCVGALAPVFKHEGMIATLSTPVHEILRSARWMRTPLQQQKNQTPQAPRINPPPLRYRMCMNHQTE